MSKRNTLFIRHFSYTFILPYPTKYVNPYFSHLYRAHFLVLTENPLQQCTIRYFLHKPPHWCSDIIKWLRHNLNFPPISGTRIIATRTRIHSRNEHKTRRICMRSIYSCDRNFFIFYRLTQRIQCFS